MADTELTGAFGFDACDDSSPFIFVSYAHQDVDHIVPIVKHLHDNGIRIWYDNGLHAGEEWLNMLLNKISSHNCTAVMLFVSSESVGRPFVRAETHHAFSMKKPIYGVYLEDGIELDPSMYAYIGQIQSTFVTRHRDQESARDEILSAAQLLIQRTPPVRRSEDRHSIDQLCHDAEILLGQRNAAGEYCRIDEAEEKYRRVTEAASNDCRGWLGLLRCRSMTVPTSPEHAAQLLADYNNYYCYIIKCDSDDNTKRLCTEYSDTLWNATLDLFDRLMADKRQDMESLSTLCAKLPDSRLLTSVSPAVTARYAEFESKLKATADSAASRNKTARAIKRFLAGVDVCLYSILSLLLIYSIAGSMSYSLNGYYSGKSPSIAFYIIALCVTVAVLAAHYWAAHVVRKNARAGKSSLLYKFAAVVMTISWIYSFFIFIIL